MKKSRQVPSLKFSLSSLKVLFHYFTLLAQQPRRLIQQPMPAAKLGLFQMIIIIMLLIIILLLLSSFCFLSFIFPSFSHPTLPLLPPLPPSLSSASHSFRPTVGSIPLSQPRPRSRSTISKAIHKPAFDSYPILLRNRPRSNRYEQCDYRHYSTYSSARAPDHSAPIHKHFSGVCYLQSPPQSRKPHVAHHPTLREALHFWLSGSGLLVRAIGRESQVAPQWPLIRYSFLTLKPKRPSTHNHSSRKARSTAHRAPADSRRPPPPPPMCQYVTLHQGTTPTRSLLGPLIRLTE